jgi:predicted ATPase
MIHSIEIKGFRALRYVNQKLSGFHVLVGPNASGKSTFLEAISFVSDILNAGLEKAVFGDAAFGISQRAGDPRDLGWMREEKTLELAVNVTLPPEIVERISGFKSCRYEISILLDDELRFGKETLWLCKDPVHRHIQRTFFPYPLDIIGTINTDSAPSGWRRVVAKKESGNDYFRAETTKWNNLFRLGPLRSALANLPEDQEKFPAATWFKGLMMSGIHRIILNAEAMRLPSRPGSPRHFLPDGSNLPWVIHELESNNPEAHRAWCDHLQTALPDLDNVTTIERPEDRSRYLVVRYKNGLEAPSWLVSDGTLRMMALTLLAYTSRVPKVILIEEPENGIHPRAIATVMQSLSSTYDTQVFCATHSPIVLSQIAPENLLCFAKTDYGAVDIVRGDEHPRLQEWKERPGLGSLFAAGVLG